MKILPTVLAFLILIPSMTLGTELGGGTWIVDGRILIEVPAGVKIKVTMPKVVQIGTVPDGPVTPGPITGTLTDAVSAVPEHANKQQNKQTMAFVIGVFARMTPASDDPATKMLDSLRQACDKAVGDDATHWSGFWSAVNSQFGSKSVSQVKASADSITSALTSDIASAAGDNDSGYAGTPDFGLPPGFLATIFKLIWPILLQMLTEMINK